MPGRRTEGAGKTSERNRNEAAAGGESASPAIDPFLMAVLASRFEAIIREMTNTVMKASRSAVIKNAQDMSCGILTYDHRLLCVEEGIPIHITALNLTTEPITEVLRRHRGG